MTVILNFRNRMEAQIEKIQDILKKDLHELKNKQVEVHNTITQKKNTTEGINRRVTKTEEQITELEDRVVDTIATEQNKEKIMKISEDSIRNLWDNIK